MPLAKAQHLERTQTPKRILALDGHGFRWQTGKDNSCSCPSGLARTSRRSPLRSSWR
jgi:hypothetical protein